MSPFFAEEDPTSHSSFLG